MSLALHVMEACGLLLAASSVRIVAGTAAGLAALALLVAMRVSSGEQSVLILPASVAIALSLRPGNAWTAALSIAVALSSACVVNRYAVLMCVPAALAVLFRTLAPDSGNSPWSAFRATRSSMLQAALVVLLPCLCAFAGLASNGTAPSLYKPAVLVLSVAPAFWFLSGIREVNAAVIAISGLPLALSAADGAGAALLLVASNVAMGGLAMRSYRLKRHDAAARLN